MVSERCISDSGDTASAAWRDAGMVVLDVSDRAQPKLIAHRDGAPPFGGGTHNCLPLRDRDLLIVLDEAVLDHQEDGVRIATGRSRRSSAASRSRPRPTIRGKADISARTICMRTGRAASFRPS